MRPLPLPPDPPLGIATVSAHASCSGFYFSFNFWHLVISQSFFRAQLCIDIFKNYILYRFLGDLNKKALMIIQFTVVPELKYIHNESYLEKTLNHVVRPIE